MAFRSLIDFLMGTLSAYISLLVFLGICLLVIGVTGARMNKILHQQTPGARPAAHPACTIAAVILGLVIILIVPAPALYLLLFLSLLK